MAFPPGQHGWYGEGPVLLRKGDSGLTRGKKVWDYSKKPSGVYTYTQIDPHMDLGKLKKYYWNDHDLYISHSSVG